MVRKDFTKKIEEFRTKSNQEKLKFLSDFWQFEIENSANFKRKK